ncbi:unnamed protein product [Phytophthora lilii]|uniref:Unnamed protein product n=1 Tax=Phytophthora lilii TaxID=2077276 RepID=A0A9W6WMB5_9STRA|nr:unnamed protein product [Phytophthora lilii]
MEEAMHFLDELKDKYLHQVEQAIFDFAHAAVKLCGYESKLVAVCTPPGGIQGIPDAESVQRLLAQIPRLDATNVAAAFAARLQDDDAQHSWQVRAKAIVLMQMLVEIKPFASRYIPAFISCPALLQQLDALRTGTHKQVIREGARKLLSLIRSNGANPALIPKGSPTAKPHVRHVLLGNKQKKSKPVAAPQIQQQPSQLTISPGKAAVNKFFRPEPNMSKSTSMCVRDPRPPLVMSPKVSQAVQASWRRRNSVTKEAHEDENLMPFQKLQAAAGPKEIRNSWIYGGAKQIGGMTRQSSITTSSNSRLDSGQISAFSFVQ